MATLMWLNIIVLYYDLFSLLHWSGFQKKMVDLFCPKIIIFTLQYLIEKTKFVSVKFAPRCQSERLNSESKLPLHGTKNTVPAHIVHVLMLSARVTPSPDADWARPLGESNIHTLGRAIALTPWRHGQLSLNTRVLPRRRFQQEHLLRTRATQQLHALAAGARKWIQQIGFYFKVIDEYSVLWRRVSRHDGLEYNDAMSGKLYEYQKKFVTYGG